MNLQEIYSIISGGDKVMLEIPTKASVNTLRANLGRIHSIQTRQLKALLEDSEVPVTSVSLRSVSVSTKVYPQMFEIALVEKKEMINFKVVKVIDSIEVISKEEKELIEDE